MLDGREQAARLVLVSVTKGNWYRTASMIEEVGSFKRLLRCEWTGFESFDVKAAAALGRKVPRGAVDRYVAMIRQLAEEGVLTVTILDPEYPVNLRASGSFPW